VLAFGSRQAGAYDAADLDFLQQVANQVAVAAENALAFEEIQALRDKLYQEKVYLEEEIPCHPVWRDSLFRHALIDSSLVRAERAAAL
jgi:GAF domain-containing protein